MSKKANRAINPNKKNFWNLEKELDVLVDSVINQSEKVKDLQSQIKRDNNMLISEMSKLTSKMNKFLDKPKNNSSQ